MRTPSVLPSLLFRQKLLLAVLAGAVFLRDAALSGVFFLLLLFVMQKGEGAKRFVLLAAAFLVGLGVSFLARPTASPCPSWASVPGKSVLAEGSIVSVTGLPGGSVRVLLEGLRPLYGFSPIEEEKARAVSDALEMREEVVFAMHKGYPGSVVEDNISPLHSRVSITLDEKTLVHTKRPILGQRMRALIRLYPTIGSINPGMGNSAAYWTDRGVWHIARLNNSGNIPIFLEFREGKGWAYQASLLREQWMLAMIRALADTQYEYLRQNDFAEECIPIMSQGRAMLLALLFGDRSFLQQETVDMFTRAGLVHSLALSGQHLALAAMAGAAFIFLLSRVWPGIFLVIPRRVLVASAGIPFALVYLFLGGAPLSLIRAALMMLAGVFFLCLRRATAPLDVLFAAALMLFLCYPLAVFDLSAQLSVLAVAGIMLVMPFVVALRKRFPAAPQGRGEASFSLPRRVLHAFIRCFGTILLISVAAQLAVLPVLVSVFGVISPNLWVNMLWLPLLAFITLPCAALGLALLVVFGPQCLSSLFFAAAALPVDEVLSFLFFLEHANLLPLLQCLRPSSLSGLGYGAMLVALVFAWQALLCGKKVEKPIKKLMAAALLLLPVGQLPVWAEDMLTQYEERVTLTTLDVGQGQALLLSYPCGRVLVDGGGSPFFDVGRNIVAPVLTAGRMPRLDAVFVSHTDADHAQGLRWILEHFQVGCLYWSVFSAVSNDAESAALREIIRRRGIPEKILSRGDALTLYADVRLEVLWPDEDALYTLHKEEDPNNNEASLALRLVRGDEGLALLCGDMTSPALGLLVETGQNLRAQALVLPHHGAASSFQTDFYDAVAPSIALASAAAFHSFGFPSRKVREEMALRNIPLYSTSESGAFSITWRKRQFF